MKGYIMKDIVVSITAASYSGNKGAAAMLQSSIEQLHERYGSRLNINLMSVYPEEDKQQIPHDFIKVVSCKPSQLLFIAFPLAILYWIFKYVKPVRKLLEKNRIIKSYCNTDVVLDEAGISFVDNRGMIMNIYAFVSGAVPMLVGIPVIKYSQALGTFNKLSNRLLAKMILPKMKLICARGQKTFDSLKSIGIEDNVKLCADGAFTMKDNEKVNSFVDQACSKDTFFNHDIIALSISSVVEKKCNKLNIDYKRVMIDFIDYLNSKNYGVLIIANAARIDSTKPRNNDLMICDEVYANVKNKDMVRWYHKEMTAEEIRAYIGRCRILVASRFHAMVGALEKKVPVLLIGWSHKYQEVLDMFDLSQYAIDFSGLNLDVLIEGFEKLVKCENETITNINRNYDKVIESSKQNVRYISEEIDIIISESKKKNLLLDFNNPDRYIGKCVACRKGYSSDESIRKNASSGGVITGLLCHLLKSKKIDGAWVTKSVIKDGKLDYETYIATTPEQIKQASTSIYMEMPLLKHLDMVRKFDGKIALVLTPCKMRALNEVLKKDVELKEKIVLKLGLYCSGNHYENATLLPLIKKGISLENAERIYYRRGYWRGQSTILYKDGREKAFSYTKTICAYKNAYFFEKESCMLCQDHYAMSSDISFGDIWLKEMKKSSIKHTSCIIRNLKALDMYNSCVASGEMVDSHFSISDLLKSQKRALVFKYNCAKAKVKYYKSKGKNIKLDESSRCKWNHRLAFYLARKNNAFSVKQYDKLKKIPTIIIYYYMCFIRVLLSF